MAGFFCYLCPNETLENHTVNAFDGLGSALLQ